MKQRTSVIFLLVLLCLVASALHADWRFVTLGNFYIAGADVDPHPATLSVALASTAPENPLATIICGDYINNFEQRNKGRFIMRGEVLFADGSTESFRGRSGIKRNQGSRCVTVGSTTEDDLIRVTYEFENLPDLTRDGGNDEDPDRFAVSTFVVVHSAGASRASTARVIAEQRAAHRRRFEEGAL